MKCNTLVFGTLLITVGAYRAAAQLIVYDNLGGEPWPLYDRPVVQHLELGDEIELSTTGEQLVGSFKLQYYAENFSGDEQVQIRFYRNDGPPTGEGFATPSTLLYDSGTVLLPIAAGQQELTLADINRSVPQVFTWTVQFSGLATGEKAEIALVSQPSIGTNSEDFWQRDGTWELYAAQGAPGSFGAQISVVPEPGATAWVFCGAAALVALARRWRRS